MGARAARARRTAPWVVCAAAVAGASCQQLRKVDREVPEAFSAVTLSGESLVRETMTGQVWVLSLWRPGCKACFKQLAAIDQLKAKRTASDVRFIALCVQGDEQAIYRAAEEAEIDSTLAYGDGAMGALGLHSLPATAFINRRAVIVASVFGITSPEALEEGIEAASR